MIRVAPTDAPANFDAEVRQPGLEAISELTGQPTIRKRRGPRRKNTGQFARPEDIPSKEFPPFWTRALPALRQAFGECCGYLGMFVAEGTGRGEVDHFVPKSAS